MSRFLSPEWFEGVRGDPATADPTLVVEQVVRDTPDGVVTYRVHITGDRAGIVWPVPTDAPPADLRITTDWATATAVAQGTLSTQAALMQGRLRFGGRPDRLADLAGAWEAVDPVPEAVRRTTTFNGA
jgi:hypothetical protein